MTQSASIPQISAGQIEQAIHFIRGAKVMPDIDLRKLYGVETKVLVQAVRRNCDRYLEDFASRLSQSEPPNLRSQIVTSSWGAVSQALLPVLPIDHQFHLCYNAAQGRNPSRTLHMANRENISVSFTPKQAEFLTNCVESGRYQSISEVVREATRLLEDQEANRKAAIHRAQQLIEEGARQLDAGEEIDMDSVFGELAKKHARLGGSKGEQ